MYLCPTVTNTQNAGTQKTCYPQILGTQNVYQRPGTPKTEGVVQEYPIQILQTVTPHLSNTLRLGMYISEKNQHLEINRKGRTKFCTFPQDYSYMYSRVWKGKRSSKLDRVPP